MIILCKIQSNPVHIRSANLRLSHSHGEDIQRVHRAPHYLKVVLKDGDGTRQGFMSTATEEGHAGIQQDGGYEGWVRDPAQAFDAAFKASWKHRRGIDELVHNDCRRRNLIQMIAL